MGQTAIVTPQIIDSTSIGRDLLTAVDQAAAQTILGVAGVDTAGDYTWTGDHTFDNGLSTDSITSSSLISTYASAGSHTYTFGVNPKYFMNATNFRPATGDEDIALGIDTRRWASVASVDGDFSGELLLSDATVGKISAPNANLEFFVEGARLWRNTYNESEFHRNRIKPAVDAGSDLGSSTHQWGNIYSVDGDFSGVVKPAGGLDIDSGQLHIKHAGSLRLGIGGAGIFMYEDILPNYSTITNGTSTKRWGNIYSVDGSFSGNLNVEDGGSYKLYNLGAEGDTDTEYLETSWNTNTASIFNKTTGSGTLRELTVGNANNRFRFTSSAILCSVNSVTRLNVGSNFTYLGSAVAVLPSSNGTIELGRTTARWQNVASVDGDFSGDVVVSGDVQTSKLRDDSGSGGFVQLTSSQAQLGAGSTTVLTATAFNVTFYKGILFGNTTSQIGSATGNRLFKLNTQNIDASGDVVMAANVDFTGLPTSDPAVAGRLWNDGGTMKISAG